ncbi:MAG: phosphotyrosine protein phosphatase [Lachnospiraceae bacterium]|nr:phosphotyrosine protein phosphatase [Lachnospiraceae bacterium]
MKYSRILFISRDDSTLGPLAETIFKSVCRDQNVEVISRGLVVLFETPINPKVEVVLGSHGYEISGRTTKALSEQDFDRNTLVLTMYEEQRKAFYESYPLINVAVLSDFVGEDEIIDPYGGTLMDYEKCFGQMTVILKKLALMLDGGNI